jgi:hypothetical protein
MLNNFLNIGHKALVISLVGMSTAGFYIISKGAYKIVDRRLAIGKETGPPNTTDKL